MSGMISKPWFLAVLAIVCTVGTQFVALKLSWEELFPPSPEVLLLKRDAPSPLKWSFSSEEIGRMKKELDRRLEAQAKKEKRLAEYEARLIADKAEIEDIKNSVDLMRQTLLADVVKLEATEIQNLKALSKTYSSIESESAVNIFAELDDSTVTKILFFMKSDVQAAILQQMAGTRGSELVQRAARLSDMLRLFTDNANENEL